MDLRRMDRQNVRILTGSNKRKDKTARQAIAFRDAVEQDIAGISKRAVEDVRGRKREMRRCANCDAKEAGARV